MTLIVDASVAIKWVLDEEKSPDARRLPETDRLAAPELMLLECANVLAIRVKRGLISTAEAEAAYVALNLMPVRTIASRQHIARAQAIAMELGQSVYDSLYLAVALAEGAVFVTADAAFARAAQARAHYSETVRPL